MPDSAGTYYYRVHSPADAPPYSLRGELVVIGQRGEGLVEPHDVAVSLRPRSGMPPADQTQRPAARSSSPEADDLAHIEVPIHPLARFRIPHHEHGPAALLGVEARQETLSGGVDAGPKCQCSCVPGVL